VRTTAVLILVGAEPLSSSSHSYQFLSPSQGTGCYLPQPGHELTTHLHLVPRLRMCGAMYCLHHESSKCHAQEMIATAYPDAGDYYRINI